VRVLHERLVPGSIPARAGEPSSAERRAFVRGSIPARAGEPRPYRRGAAYRLYASIFLQIDDLDGGADKLGRAQASDPHVRGGPGRTCDLAVGRSVCGRAGGGARPAPPPQVSAASRPRVCSSAARDRSVLLNPGECGEHLTPHLHSSGRGRLKMTCGGFPCASQHRSSHHRS
jgi:hypothetical protein